jgi:hypothetical protein
MLAAIFFAIAGTDSAQLAAAEQDPDDSYKVER